MIDVIQNKQKKPPTAEEIKEAQEEWYAENAPLGKKLGYPECCIKAFGDQPPGLLKMGGKEVQKDAKLRYKAACINGVFTGFIPCTAHAEQINTGKITLASLIKADRDKTFPPFPDYPFPNAYKQFQRPQI